MIYVNSILYLCKRRGVSCRHFNGIEIDCKTMYASYFCVSDEAGGM